MEFKPTNPKSPPSGFTLVEFLVAAALSVTLIAGAASFYVFSIRSFSAIFNYADLNAKDRYASDLLSRDIRSALSVVSYSATNLVFSASDGTNVVYSYDPAMATLTRTKGGYAQVLLTLISTNSFAFSLYQRPTNSAAPYEQFPTATTAASVKLVGFQWSCVRPVAAGVAQDSESLYTAIVNIRNR
jgi:hypothetical protein